MNAPETNYGSRITSRSVLTAVIALALCAVWGAISTAEGSLILGAPQFNLGDVLPSPLTAVSGDLLETSVSSAIGENSGANPRNGTTGTAQENDATNPAQVWGSSQTTYDLNTTSSPLGYDINEIRLFSGWMDSRSGQSYTIDYSLVGAPATFIELGGSGGLIQDLETNGGSLLTRTYDSAGANILTGVAAIQFNFVANGNAGPGTVIREIDVLGAPTVVPEPASVVLLGLGAIGLWMAARRRNGAIQPAPHP